MTTDEILERLVDGTNLEGPFFSEPVTVLSAKVERSSRRRTKSLSVKISPFFLGPRQHFGI